MCSSQSGKDGGNTNNSNNNGQWILEKLWPAYSGSYVFDGVVRDKSSFHKPKSMALSSATNWDCVFAPIRLSVGVTHSSLSRENVETINAESQTCRVDHFVQTAGNVDHFVSWEWRLCSNGISGKAELDVSNFFSSLCNFGVLNLDISMGFPISLKNNFPSRWFMLPHIERMKTYGASQQI